MRKWSKGIERERGSSCGEHGWRFWTAAPRFPAMKFGLLSPFNRTLWPDGSFHAMCDRYPRHTAPAEGCECGLVHGDGSSVDLRLHGG